MFDTLWHLYRKGNQPFQSLSRLEDDQARLLMQGYFEPGAIIWERFADSAGYLQERRETEAWLYQAFIAKGGKPRQRYPVYMVLGRSRWMETHLDPIAKATTEEISIPLVAFNPSDLSFTFPDSMVTRMIAAEKNPQYYQPDLHGQVFTLQEIKHLINTWGIPDRGPGTNLPDGWACYIEAQIWNVEPLGNFSPPKHK